MLSDFEEVLGRLNVASRNGEKAMCFCPAHDDRNNPSLSLKAENGRLLLHCFAGCRPETVVSEIGLELKDLFAEGGGGFSIPHARLHACTPMTETRMPMRKTGVQRVIHARNTAARLRTTPQRRSCRRNFYAGWA